MKTYQCIKKENMSFTLLGVIKKMSFSFLFEWIRIFVLKFHKMLYQLYYHIYTTIYIHIWPSRFKFIFINPPTTPLSYLLTPLPSLLPSSPFSPLVFLHLNPPPPLLHLLIPPSPPASYHTYPLSFSSFPPPSFIFLPALSISHPVPHSFPSRSLLFPIPFLTLSHPVLHSFPSCSSLFPIPFLNLPHPVLHSFPSRSSLFPHPVLHSFPSLPSYPSLPTPLLFPSQHSYLFISSLTFYNVHDTS